MSDLSLYDLAISFLKSVLRPTPSLRRDTFRSPFPAHPGEAEEERQQITENVGWCTLKHSIKRTADRDILAVRKKKVPLSL